MVVVVIIGLLAAMGMPTYRHITMRAKTTAVENDLKTFSTAFITYSLQNGKWPADEVAHVIPTVMAGALPPGFGIKTPIGGYYKWCFDSNPGGVVAKAALMIEDDASAPLSDDQDLRMMIDKQMDDGNLTTGNIQVGFGNSLVFILEK